MATCWSLMLACGWTRMSTQDHRCPAVAAADILQLRLGETEIVHLTAHGPDIDGLHDFTRPARRRGADAVIEAVPEQRNNRNQHQSPSKAKA